MEGKQDQEDLINLVCFITFFNLFICLVIYKLLIFRKNWKLNTRINILYFHISKFYSLFFYHLYSLLFYYHNILLFYHPYNHLFYLSIILCITTNIVLCFTSNKILCFNTRIFSCFIISNHLLFSSQTRLLFYLRHCIVLMMWRWHHILAFYWLMRRFSKLGYEFLWCHHMTCWVPHGGKTRVVKQRKRWWSLVLPPLFHHEWYSTRILSQSFLADK